MLCESAIGDRRGTHVRHRSHKLQALTGIKRARPHSNSDVRLP